MSETRYNKLRDTWTTWSSQWGIQARSITYCVTLLVVSAALLSTAIIFRSYQSAQSSAQHDASLYVEAIAYDAEAGVLVNDVKAIKHLVAGTARNASIYATRIIDRHGEVLAQFIREDDPTDNQDSALFSSFPISSDDTTHISLGQHGHFMVSAPILRSSAKLDDELLDESHDTAESNYLGVVTIDYNSDKLYADLRWRVQESVLILLLILIAGISITIVMVRRLLCPISELAVAASEIEHGNFTHIASENALGEIGALACTFNSMARSLADQTHDLERQVQQRTIELNNRRRRLEIEVKERKRAQGVERGRNQVLVKMTSGATLDESMNELIQSIESMHPDMKCSIMLVDPHEPCLRHCCSPSLPSHYAECVDGIPIKEGAGSCGTSAYRARRVIVEDVKTDPLWSHYIPLANSIGIRACWSEPIISNLSVVLGTFAMYFTSPRSPHDDDISTIISATRVAGLAIEKSISDLQNQAHTQQQETVAALGQLALSNYGLSELFDAAVRRIADTLHVPMCKVLQLSDDRKKLQLIAGVGWHEGLVGKAHVLSREKSQAGYTLLQNAPVIVTELETETRFTGPALLKEHGVISGMSVIIPGPKAPWGVLGAHSADQHHFTEDDINFFKVVANVLAEAIERVSAEKNMHEARIHAEEGSRAKSEFLANMSHEIRTPMNGIMGMTELVLKSKLTHEQTEGLQTVMKCADSLLILVNDILDFSKIEAGKLDFEQCDFELEDVITDVINMFTVEASRKNLLLTSERNKPTFPLVKGDAHRLRQILINLVGNAIKFTSQGEVKVKVTQQAQHNNQAEFLFDVSDTGVGINQSHLSKIFKSFTQADGATTRQFGGTGLGLAISKKLIELMGGQIRVESQLGVGSVFTFSITLTLSERQKGQVESDKSMKNNHELNTRPASRESRVLKVLLTDDNLVNRTVAKGLLKHAGHEVFCATNGLEALKELEENTIDIVLMDVQMPVLDGLEATRRIRAQSCYEQLPIIAMTAHAMKGDREKCLDAGMSDYITKPINGELLCQMIDKWTMHLESKDDKDQVSTQDNSENDRMRSERHPLDTEEALERLGGNHELYVKVVEMFILSAPNIIDRLVRAIDNEAWDQFSLEAHSLKGAASNIGAGSIQRIAEQMEALVSSHIDTELRSAVEQAQSELERLRHTSQDILSELLSTYGS